MIADASDPPQVAGAGNAVHHHAEHDRRHDHRNQLEESIGKEFQADGEIGRRHAERDAKDEPCDHLREEGLVKGPTGEGGAATGVIGPLTGFWIGPVRKSLATLKLVYRRDGLHPSEGGDVSDSG